MKTITATTIFLLGIVMSASASAITDDYLNTISESDAVEALQNTQHSILVDLKKSVKTTLPDYKSDKREIFGVDDVHIYAQNAQA